MRWTITAALARGPAQSVSAKGPIVLLDHFDNSASGGTQDTMTVLGAILDEYEESPPT